MKILAELGILVLDTATWNSVVYPEMAPSNSSVCQTVSVAFLPL